jgi:hypothetical protein
MPSTANAMITYFFIALKHFYFGHKGTNKRAKYQIYLGIFEREIATPHFAPSGQRTFSRSEKGTLFI